MLQWYRPAAVDPTVAVRSGGAKGPRRISVLLRSSRFFERSRNGIARPCCRFMEPVGRLECPLVSHSSRLEQRERVPREDPEWLPEQERYSPMKALPTPHSGHFFGRLDGRACTCQMRQPRVEINRHDNGGSVLLRRRADSQGTWLSLNGDAALINGARHYPNTSNPLIYNEFHHFK